MLNKRRRRHTMHFPFGVTISVQPQVMSLRREGATSERAPSNLRIFVAHCSAPEGQLSFQQLIQVV